MGILRQKLSYEDWRDMERENDKYEMQDYLNSENYFSLLTNYMSLYENDKNSDLDDYRYISIKYEIKRLSPKFRKHRLKKLMKEI